MYSYWLANVEGMTPVRITQIYEYCESAKALYQCSDEEIRRMEKLGERVQESVIGSRKNWNVEREWGTLAQSGISFVSREHANYPDKLKEIHRAPYALYYTGRLPDPEKTSVAIVGARGRSAYGSQVARKLGRELAAAGVEVISGMALGIDSDGHAGAMDGKGATYAVLGCGVDICYPPGNRYLYEKIREQGGLISEYPPGTRPQRQNFPMRNRIIAGMSDYVVVIEARKKSGSLITADYALEQGREVYALPGRITDELSQGCISLLAQGAGVLAEVEAFVADITENGRISYTQPNFLKNLLEKDESLVYSLFDFAPLGIGTIVGQTPYSLSEVVTILERMEQKGFIQETIPNYYIKTI